MAPLTALALLAFWAYSSLAAPTGLQRTDDDDDPFLDLSYQVWYESLFERRAKLAKRQSAYSSMVVFGASYQDNAHARPSQYASSMRPSPYFEGRWSDGAVGAEYVAIGICAPITDYAYGGAHIDNTLTTGTVPATADQINTYIADLNSGSAKVKRGSGRVLHFFWAGINPVTQIWNEWQKDGDAARATSRATANANALLRQAQSLSSNAVVTNNTAGVDLFIVPIPPLETIPTFGLQATPLNDATQLAVLAQITTTFNSVLSNGIATLQKSDTSRRKTITYDLPTRWKTMMSTSSAFTNVNSACYNSATGKTCSQPDRYFFWDTLHPTTLVHNYLGNAFARAILKA